MPDSDVKPINPVEKHCNVLTRYHYYVFFFVFLSKTPLFWHILNLIFLSPPMQYRCPAAEEPPHDAPYKDICPCEEPVWNRSVFTETMQTKFNVYCERKWLVSFSQSMAYAGALVGSFVFGFLSDKYGRLTVFSLSCLLIAISGCLITVMRTAAGFICMRFIEGIGVGGAVVTSYVLCIEYCGMKQREIVTALFHLPLNVGHITLPIISYFLRHCDHFQLAISIPIFFFALLIFMMLESPKWLMDNDRIDQVTLVIERFTRGRIPREVIKEEVETYITTHAKNTKRNVKFWEIFKHRRLSLNLGCMIVAYFVCGLGYYGVSQFIGQMSGNIHLNVGTSGAMLIPGTLFCVFVLGIVSRRNFLMTSNMCAGVFMICAVFMPLRFNWLRVLFACFGLTCFFVSFIVAFLYGVELFPTSVRSSVLGLLSVMARLGQIVNPPINSLSETISGLIFGVMAIIGGLLCCLLPDTMNQELPSSLEDTDVINKRHPATPAQNLNT